MSEQIKHKWLPSEPTQEMLEAVGSLSTLLTNCDSRYGAYKTIYNAMWQAAPAVGQEPIAYLGLEDACDPAELAFDKGDLPHSFVTPLYTHPQPKD
jgi:hypothetical protein